MTTKENVLLAVAKTIKGTSFIGVKNYENAQGEVSNQTILAGISYENALNSDFITLKENRQIVFDTLLKDYPFELVKEAYKKVYESLEKRTSTPEFKEKLRLENDQTIKRSDAQINAFNHIAKGVKVHKDTDKVFIFGLVVKKTVLTPIEYKQTKSKDLTIVQNKIKKLCDFRQNKYKEFVFEKSELKIQGITL